MRRESAVAPASTFLDLRWSIPLQLEMLLQSTHKFVFQVKRIVKAQLLPVPEIEADCRIVVLHLLGIGQQDEVVLRRGLPLVKPHQKADLVVDVLVALRQISNQKSAAVDNLQNLVCNSVAVTFVHVVDADRRQSKISAM